MRTKALFLTAAAGLVSFAVTAQVVSVNVVGFVNRAVPAGWVILNNPLSATANNLVEEVLPAANLVDGTEIYKFDAQNQSYAGGYSQVLFSEWTDKTMTLKPGEGFWLSSPTAQNITFVGEVKQGTLVTPVSGNYNLVGSQVPQEGKLTADLGYAPVENDTVYQYLNPPVSGQVWSSAQVLFTEWSAEPIIKIGEGFFLFRDPAAPTSDWSRNFSVAP